MSMEGAAWSSLYRLSHSKDQKTFSRDTVRRTFAFAAPYKGKITVFVLLSVVMAVAGGRHPGPRRPGSGRDHRQSGRRVR